MTVRDARRSETSQLAKTWHDAWHDAHSRIVPAELARLRTLESEATKPSLSSSMPAFRSTNPDLTRGGGGLAGARASRRRQLRSLVVTRLGRLEYTRHLSGKSLLE